MPSTSSTSPSAGPSAGELRKIAQAVGGVDKLIDREGKRYLERGLKYAAPTGPRIEQALIDDPLLLRTPIVRAGARPPSASQTRGLGRLAGPGRDANRRGIFAQPTHIDLHCHTPSCVHGRPQPAPPRPLPRGATVAQPPAALLRPLARVERISLFEREVKERLSRAALDVLFAAAGRDVRGAARGPGRARAVLRVDHADHRAGRVAAQPCATPPTPARPSGWRRCWPGTPAPRRASSGWPPRSASGWAAPARAALSADIKVRARGTTVYVDVDVEASF